MSAIIERPTPKTSAHVVRTASGARVMAMYLDAPELTVELNALREQVTRDRTSAKQFLISVGIMNRSGKTAKNFGG